MPLQPVESSHPRPDLDVDQRCARLDYLRLGWEVSRRIATKLSDGPVPGSYNA